MDAAIADKPAEDTVPEAPDGFHEFSCYYQPGDDREHVEVNSWKKAYMLVREGIITASDRCTLARHVVVISLGSC